MGHGASAVEDLKTWVKAQKHIAILMEGSLEVENEGYFERIE